MGYLGNMNQQQLMQLLGGGLNNLGGSGMFAEALASGSNATTPVSTRSADKTSKAPGAPKKKPDNKGAVQLSDLQSILSGIKVPDKEQTPSVDLSLGITNEAVAPLLTNPAFVTRMKELLPNVVEGDVANEVSSTITSPQFQQALKIFSSGLQSGQLAPLIREFNLGDSAVAAATAGDMESFIKAITKKEEKKEEGDTDMKDA